MDGRELDIPAARASPCNSDRCQDAAVGSSHIGTSSRNAVPNDFDISEDDLKQNENKSNSNVENSKVDLDSDNSCSSNVGDLLRYESSVENRVQKVDRIARGDSKTINCRSRNHLQFDCEARNHQHRDKIPSQPDLDDSNISNSPSNLAAADNDDILVPAYCLGYTSNDNEPKQLKVSTTYEICTKSEPKTKIDLQVISNSGQVKENYVTVAVDHNWQASKSTIKDRLAFMFNNELMADVHFIVGGRSGGNIKRIPAHKFVLSISSAVFDAMFNSRMATTECEIELPDIEPAAFLSLLRFFYSDEVMIGPETVMATLYAAKKYAVPALEQACVDFLKMNLSSDNAFMLLSQARLFDEPQLAAMCLDMIDKTTSDAFSADGFTDLDLDTLCVVLERDSLGIKESKLFSAIIRWAESECMRQSIHISPENQRKVLGRAMSLIRFPLMTVEEFAVGVAQSGILSDREVVELFLYFTVKPRPVVKFSEVLRCCLTGKEQVISRFCQVEKRWGYSGTTDRIRFTVNKKIFVVGFGLYGSVHSPAEYSVNIQIIHTDTSRVCGVNDVTFQSDGSMSPHRAMFKEPVEINPNTNYTACSTIRGPDSYYGTKGLRKVTHESAASGKVTFQFTYAAGNNNGTSVEDGQLPEIIFYT